MVTGEKKEAADIGNRRNPYRLIKSAGIWKSDVGELLKEAEGPCGTGQLRWL